MSDGLHILGVKVQDMLRVEFAEFKPAGGSVTISGANAAGKSSILDAIAFALGGESLIPKDPIRTGQAEAEVTVDIGDFVVKRRFVRTDKAKDGYNSYLTVLGKDGGKYTNGQTVLNGVLGKLTFDPAAFAEMPPKQQLATLQELVPLGIDLKAWQFAYDGVYQKRRDAGRDADRLKATLASTPKPTATVAIDLEPIKAKLKAATDAELAFDAESALLNSDAKILARQEQSLKARLEGIEDQVKRHKADMAAYNKAGEDLHKRMQALVKPEAVDFAALEAELDAARTNNANLGAAEAYKKLEIETGDAVDTHGQFEVKLAQLVKQRDDAIGAAKFPVPGLAFGEAGVLYKNLPFEQASQSEKIDVSLAIGMAANPRLKVLFVRQGSLLDETSRARIEQRATENDYQVWYEVVDTSGKVGFYIEEGRLAAVDGEAVQSPVSPVSSKTDEAAPVPVTASAPITADIAPPAQPIKATVPVAAPVRKKPTGPPKRSKPASPTGDLMGDNPLSPGD